ncbi:MAG: hypothetical protein WKF41_03770 [Gaiellaceae bacterium]
MRTGGTTPRPSTRLQLARVALDAALTVAGVVGPVGALESATATARDRVPGVLVVALNDRRYDVSLHLIAAVVPLHDLADRIRERVVRAATAAGLARALGPVNVVFEDVVAGEARAGR